MQTAFHVKYDTHVCVLQLAAMKNFNQDFQQIGEEVKKLKEVHAAAKAVSKKEQQKVREIKDHIAELTMAKEVCQSYLAQAATACLQQRLRLAVSPCCSM